MLTEPAGCGRRHFTVVDAASMHPDKATGHRLAFWDARDDNHIRIGRHGLSHNLMKPLEASSAVLEHQFLSAAYRRHKRSVLIFTHRRLDCKPCAVG